MMDQWDWDQPVSEERAAKRAAYPKWEEVADWTYRLPVPGGWLYRYGITNTEGMVFVPST